MGQAITVWHPGTLFNRRLFFVRAVFMRHADVLRESIAYRYIATERGGCVEISSQNAEALSAIHDFLDFQIKEHQTGDKP